MGGPPHVREVTALYFDESGDMEMLPQLPQLPQLHRLPRVQPYDIPCRYCGAGPGESCVRFRERKTVRLNRDKPHPDRVYDARRASEAADALAPR